MQEEVLKQLAELPESTHHDLFKSLMEILEDREALTLLEDTVRDLIRTKLYQMMVRGFNISCLPLSWISTVLEKVSPHRMRLLTRSWMFLAAPMIWL